MHSRVRSISRDRPQHADAGGQPTVVLRGGHEALGRFATGLEVGGERRAHGAEDDRGNLAPLGQEQLCVRPVIGRESAHDQDHAVGPRLRALGRQGIDAGQIHDRLGVHLADRRPASWRHRSWSSCSRLAGPGYRRKRRAIPSSTFRCWDGGRRPGRGAGPPRRRDGRRSQGRRRNVDRQGRGPDGSHELAAIQRCATATMTMRMRFGTGHDSISLLVEDE